MTRVNPWHSKLKRIKVYHNNNKCDTGNNIEPENWKPGRGNKERLCLDCKKLNQQGK